VRFFRVFCVIGAIMLALPVSAAPKKHRVHRRATHTTARVHKRLRSHATPSSTSPSSDPLDPQLQLTTPHASAPPAETPSETQPVVVRTAAEAPPVAPHDAPPPEPAQLDSPKAARADLTLHDNDAPPPAMLASVPEPKKRATDLGRQRRWGLFGGGVALFLIGYGADIGLSYGLHHEPATNSLIPIAGPLVQMRDSWAMVARAQTGNPQVDVPANQRIDAVNAQIQTVAYAALAVDCAIQVIGATLTVAGVVGKSRTKYAAIEPAPSGVRVRF
jgi:hypothetical protein